ncbi:hypothetical protein SBRCBS47491_008018 [Sporothrix bragantina]|uniref:Quinate utilization oxidoreductase QutH n=1 Tax=Sporothrix bragantina TaxID=671064 RepID=A0ABP0CKV7_9PEZI
MSEAPLKVAIVGFSGLIGKRHTVHVLENPATDLIAVIDPSPGAASIKTDLGVPETTPIFADVADLLKSTTVPKPDCAIICTPPHTHVPISTTLIEAGIHVLVEKPISDTVESGRALVALAKKNNVHLLVGHHRRFNPYIVAAKKAVSEGIVGNVLAVSAIWALCKPDPYFDADPALSWRKSRSRGGGVVLTNFVHEADILQHLLGRIVRVHAEEITPQRNAEARKDPQHDMAEEGVALTLRFASGVVGTFILSDAAVSPHSFEMGTGENPHIPRVRSGHDGHEAEGDEIDVYRILGTHGTLSVPDLILTSYGKGNARSWNDKLQREKLAIDTDPRVPFERQLDHFVKVVRGQEEPSCTGQAGLAAVQVCQAILESLATKKTVDIAE